MYDGLHVNLKIEWGSAFLVTGDSQDITSIILLGQWK